MILLESTDGEEGALYDSTKVILATAGPGEIAIISTRIKIIKALFSGFDGRALNNEQHKYLCEQLAGEVEYFVLDNARLNPCDVMRQSLHQLCKTFPELEVYSDRLCVFQLEWNERTLHVVIDQPGKEGLNAVLISPQEKKYLPSPQRVRFFLKHESREEAKDFSKATKVIIATANGKELKRMFPDKEIKRYTAVEEVSFCLDQGLSTEYEIYIIEGLKIKTGFYVRHLFEKDQEDEKQKNLDEFMKSL